MRITGESAGDIAERNNVAQGNGEVLMSRLNPDIKETYLGLEFPAWMTPKVFNLLQNGFEMRLDGESKPGLAAILL